jgi:hypothetical protein
MKPDYLFFLAVDFFVAGDFFAVDVLAVLFFAVDFFLGVDFFFAVDFFLAAGMLTSSRGCLGRHALQPTPLPFAHPAPYAVPLVATERIVQALDPNGTVGADALGFSGGPALLREEDLRVVIPAAGSVLPWNEVMHRIPSKLHSCNSAGTRQEKASPGRDLFRRECGALSSSFSIVARLRAQRKM